jgi:1-aminocyclopropane-1-carboxylate deaminase/D-cysteine desulfhydrase-like pyridoxal-dependent ACC family enzyme
VLSRGNHSDEVQGNLLLDHILGATVEIVDAPIGPELDALIAETAQRFRAQGRRAYCWDRDVCKPRASVSYAICMAEIVEQLAQQGQEPGVIYICSAGSTGAGMALGKAALGLAAPLRLIAPIRWPWDTAVDLAHTANVAAEMLGLSCRVTPGDIDVTDAHIGAGYGLASPEGLEAIRLLARTEGILLDPVYTGKALAALMHDVRTQRVPTDGPIVFVHTGGTPALFAYRDELMQFL